jgi:EAL domain-containing protein (putative c-di-GMP-specific phosphodiesterase class I)
VNETPLASSELGLAGLVNSKGVDKVDRILDLVRRHLQMDVSYVSEFTGSKQTYRGVDGDADSFRIALGQGPELSKTYCQRMVQGQIPRVVPDSQADPRVRELSSTIGAYIGVPLLLSDGTMYGTFCCLSQKAEAIDERDVQFMSMLAEVLVEELDAQRQLAKDRTTIEALFHGQSLQIALQPIVDVHNGRCLGVEALSRFPKGCGSPDVVFEAAHKVALGAELEALAVQKAVTFLPQLAAEQYLSVNLTPSVALEVADRIFQGVAESLHQLVLEVTENAAVEGYAAFRRALAPLREQGLRLSIDDAGSGYASLHHIVELQPDIIKIDRSLIDGLATDPSRRSAVRAFVALAADLGATVVAEGVETVTDLDAVRDLGIGAVQGFLLARPSTDPGVLAEWSRPLAIPAASQAQPHPGIRLPKTRTAQAG